ncbi:MAG: hypothetical protein KBT33_04755 [Prevotellaceae bacterium]|nr:hypothetical protein [Candidatus Minthosoma equi]
MTYSIAIRTLGTAGYKFKQELQSIAAQTIQPEKVIVYIAEGYARPDFNVGLEEYVWVPKGMVAQRALPYNEITSDYVLLLDDDMLLAPDVAEKLLLAATEHKADCVGADSYQHYARTLGDKIYDFATNLIVSHGSNNSWAFRIQKNGSFSYNSHPVPGYYDSQYIAGAVQLWKRDVLISLHLEDEMWLDRYEFAFNDDMLETYKLHINGHKLGILFGLDVVHLDAGSGSRPYRASARQFYVREASLFCLWWRMIYEPSRGMDRGLCVTSKMFKIFWLFSVHVIGGIFMLNIQMPVNFIKGFFDAWKFVHSDEYKRIGGYRFSG